MTVGKYLRDARAFMAFAAGRSVDKALVAAYKQRLLEQGYAARSVNSMLAGLNSLLGFLGWQDCRVRNVRVQRRIYCAEERELTKAEYLRLLEAARRDRRLYLLLETICGTGFAYRNWRISRWKRWRRARSPSAARTKRAASSSRAATQIAAGLCKAIRHRVRPRVPHTGAEGRWTAAASGRR